MDERIILKQFEHMVARFEAAWNRHSAHDLAAMFAVDAEFISVCGLWWRGRGQIEAAYVQYHASAYKCSVLEVRINTTKVLSAETALLICEWDLEGQLGAGGVRRPPDAGVMSWMLTWNRGEWLVSVSQNTYRLDSRVREIRYRDEADMTL